MEQEKNDGLPEGWEMKKLREIAKIFTWSPAPQNTKNFENGTEPFVRTSDLGVFWKNPNLITTRDKLNPDFLTKGMIRAKRWTILFPKSGASILTNNRAMLWMDAYIVSHLGAIYSNEQITNRYIYHFLSDFNLWILCENEAYPSLKLDKVAEIGVPIPPLTEQERIVAKLDGIFEHIDASIKLLEQNITDADAMEKSINYEIFNSTGFEFQSLDSVVSIISWISLPPIFNKNWNNNGLIPFYKVAQMNNDSQRMKGALLLFNEETSKREKIKIFPRWTVVFPKRWGAIFTNKKRILTEDASYDSNIMGLKANPEALSDEYLLCFLNSVDFWAIVDDAGIPQINNKHIRGIKIPLPPLPEQKRIVAKLDAFFAEQKAIKSGYEAKIFELKALKSSILSEAFQGKI